MNENQEKNQGITSEQDFWKESEPKKTENEPDELSEELREQREKKVEGFSLELTEEQLDQESRELSSYSSDYVRNQKAASDRTQRKRRKEGKLHRRRTHGFMYAVLYLLIVGIIVGVASDFLISGAYDLLAADRPEGTAIIEIKPETTDDEVIDLLYDAGAIQNKLFYKLYATVTDASYRAGTYNISTKLDYEGIINSLQSNSNRSDTVKLTFIEGETAQTIAAKLEAANVCSASDFLNALNAEDFTNYKFIRRINNPDERAYFIEGYLFPDTYEFYMYENPKTVIKRFLNNINGSKLTAEMYDRAESLGMSIDEIWTLASIIQKEAGNKEDMFLISSAFHNRLNNWGETAMLQSDVTKMYEDALIDQFPQIENLYDTYDRSGLPAGPICNPGMDAIRAALYPKKTNYYYFVADVNGKTYYATTLAQHEANIAFTKTVTPNNGTTGSQAPAGE